MWYLQLADFGIELRFEEVVVRVRLAEWVMVKESLRSRTLMRVSVGIKKKKKKSALPNDMRGRTYRSTYIVKQSYMNASASGLIFMDTLSGIGGA